MVCIVFRGGEGVFPAAPAIPAAVVPVGGGGGRAEPRRHLFALPRGRGPSQTPPSLATDSSISPGPPSPWLPALLIENRFLSVLRRAAGSGAGMQGAKPLAQNNLKSPPSRREGGWGSILPLRGRGQKSKLKAGLAGDKAGKPPCEHRSGKVGGRLPPPCAPRRARGSPLPQCRAGLVAGMQGAKPLA